MVSIRRLFDALSAVFEKVSVSIGQFVRPIELAKGASHSLDDLGTDRFHSFPKKLIALWFRLERPPSTR
jgi:hypothetical protein